MVKRKPNPQFLTTAEILKDIWIDETKQFAKNDFFLRERYSNHRPLTPHVKDIFIEDVVSWAIAVNRIYFQREVLELAQKYDEEIEIAEILKEWDTKAEKQVRHVLETIKDEF